MAAGDHDRAVGLQMDGGVIQQRRGDHADIGNLAAGVDQAFEQRVMQARRTQAAVAAQINPLAAAALQQGPEPAAEVGDVGSQQFRLGNAANIVFAKNGGVEHSLSS